MYNTSGNTLRQKSDNCPLFNSKEMLNFASELDTRQVKVSPGHPSANNVETEMKPLGNFEHWTFAKHERS